MAHTPHTSQPSRYPITRSLLAAFKFLGTPVVKRTANTPPIHPQQSNRPGWYVVNIGSDGEPACETGPFKTQRDAAHYANNLTGVI